jgi:hypothetical protein
MKRSAVVVLLLFCVVGLYAQDRGIGLRLGNPMGITFKKYLPRNKAVELGVGTVAPGWHQHYYENSFHDFDKYEGFEYRSHDVRSTVYLQGRYLLDYDIHIEGLIGQLDWYWGLGGMLKLATIEYRFRESQGPDIIRTAHDFDIGPEGIIGMEYTFENAPITLFGEISLMIEIADRPGIARGFSGVGARYNF